MNERYAIVAVADNLLVVDTREQPHRTVAICEGWSKWEHANLICDALNAFDAPIAKIMDDAVKGTKRNVE